MARVPGGTLVSSTPVETDAPATLDARDASRLRYRTNARALNFEGRSWSWLPETKPHQHGGLTEVAALLRSALEAIISIAFGQVS